MSMTNDTEAAHEAVSEAWRAMIGLRMIEDREGKVLSGQNVAHLKTVQAALATAHVHIGNALAHVAALLDSADENNDTAVHVGVHGRAALTQDLQRIRTLRRSL